MANQPPIPNPSPKARFQQTPARVHGHREMVSSSAFEQSADFALLQYAADLSSQIRDPNSAIGAGLKLQGAQEFLQCFRLLAESVRPLPGTPVSSNLNPNV